MAQYEVTVTRTETIVFALDAESPEDAENRYLMDGDEIASYSGQPSVERVTPVEGV